MVRGLTLRLGLLAALLPAVALAQTPHTVGPLQAQNDLADIDNAAAARANLGVGSVGTLQMNGNAGQFLNGAGGWVTPSIAYSQLPALSANQVLGAQTAGQPSAIAVPSCSGPESALTWVVGTGFGCQTFGTLAGQSAGAVAITGGSIIGATIAGGDVSGARVTTQAGTTAQTLADRFAEVFDVLDFGATRGTTDSAPAFQAALSALAVSQYGGVLEIPSGNYTLGSSVSVTLGAGQRLIIRSGGQHAARLHWTNPASAGINVTLAATPSSNWLSGGPSVAARDLTFVSDWSATDAQTALTITQQVGDGTSTFTRSLPPAVYVDNVASISNTNSGGFLHLLALTDVATSKFDNMSMWCSTGDTTAGAVTVAASSNHVSTGLRFDGLRQEAGGTALTITDYIQGVYVTDMQTVGTQHSISWTNPAGYTGADNLIVEHSQLNSKISEIDTDGVRDVQVSSNYFLAGAPGWYGAKVTGQFGDVFTGNAFTVASGDVTASGVIVNNVTAAAVVGNEFYGIQSGSATAAPILLTGSTQSAVVAGNTSQWTYVAWDASANPGLNRMVNNYGAIGGANMLAFAPGTAGQKSAVMQPQGSDSNILSVFQAKGLPLSDFLFNDGTGRPILRMDDCQLAAGNSCEGVKVWATAAGKSPIIEPFSSGDNFMLGVPGALATTATSGMVQIPYMSGTPTGTPATTGGATLIYNAASHSLDVYDPVAAGWYHITLTPGGG